MQLIDSNALQSRVQSWDKGPAPVKIPAYKDVPSLNTALKTGQIDKTQWVQQYKVLHAKETASLGPTTDSSLWSRVKAYGPSSVKPAAKQVFVSTPVAVAKSIPQSEKVVATGIARTLPGGMNDIKANEEQARQASANTQNIMANLRAGKINVAQANKQLQISAGSAGAASKAQAETIKAMPTKGQLAAGFAGTAADILTAGSLSSLKGVRSLETATAAARATKVIGASAAFGADAGLGTAASGGTKKQILENTAVGAALPILGAGAGKLKQVFKDGPQKLLDNVKTAQALNVGREANKPVKATVEDLSSPSKVDVRTPTHATVTGTPTADKINVRTPDVMSEQDFHKQFNNYSKAYDKEQKQLEAASTTLAPSHVKAVAEAIDRKYQQKMNDLVDRFNAPPLTAPVAPKSIKLPKEPKTPAVKTAPTRDVSKIPEAQVVEKSTVAAPKETKSIPATTPTSGDVRTSGGATKAEQRAVEAKLATEFEDKAAYTGQSYKNEAKNAVDLVNSDPEKARRIANGLEPGNNTVHEVAVAHAIENKALKEGDAETLRQLALSSRHTKTSEAAQRLGAEGYAADPSSPVAHLRAVVNARTAAVAKKVGDVPKAITKETATIKAAVKAPTKEDWNSFIRGLACK